MELSCPARESHPMLAGDKVGGNVASIVLDGMLWNVELGGQPVSQWSGAGNECSSDIY